MTASTNCLLDCLSMSLYKYFKEWTSVSASLPDLKGSLSDYLPTASPERCRRIAEANKEVLKAVAEAKEPQKKGP